MNGRLANRMADDPVNDKVSRQLADLSSKKKNSIEKITLHCLLQPKHQSSGIESLTRQSPEICFN